MSFRRIRSRCAGSVFKTEKARRGRRGRRLLLEPLEQLEDRLAPATLLVNSSADNTTDTSHLTLREAVSLVNNGGNPAYLDQSSMPAGWASQISGAFGDNDTITFSPALNGAIISLAQGQLELTAGAGTVTIEGVGQIAVGGDNENRVFQVDAGATADIMGITIEDGGSGTGGGILNFGTLTVSNSTLADNLAGAGGGIANSTGGTLTLINCSVAANSAGNGAGGGILNSGRLTVINSTVADNSAGEGGGIDNLAAGSATLNNTIVADSTAGGDLSGGAFSGSNDLIGDGSSLTSFSKSVQGNPLLAPLGNYGGPTQTMALLPGSPAIAAGSTALAVDGNGHPLSADQRGQPRISGSAVDIGAYESNGLAGTSASAVLFPEQRQPGQHPHQPGHCHQRGIFRSGQPGRTLLPAKQWGTLVLRRRSSPGQRRRQLRHR